MEKKALKDALSVKAKEAFVSGDTQEGDKSPKRQVAKLPLVKVGFYWSQETENELEELRLKLRKQGRRLTRSEVTEKLVKRALQNEQILADLG